ncbi:MAG: LamG domain-containing protein [Ginsengibacter sp.]
MKSIFLIMMILPVCFTISSCKKTDSGTGINVTAVAPVVTTNDAANINGNNVSIGGNITNDGGSIVTEAGICYNTAAGVDTSKNRMPTYPISGNYSIGLKGLKLLTPYYYKAYAINEKGITYGAEKTFTLPVPGYSSSSQVAAANLIAYWAFEGGYVDSVSRTAGTPNHSSALSFVTGQRGQAVQVASPGYINSNIGNTVAGLQNFSYVLWIKHPSTLDPAGSHFTYFPFSLNAVGFSWENTKFFMLFNNKDDAANSYGKVGLNDQWFDIGQKWPKMLDGNWHQLTVSFSGTTGTLKIYVDGSWVGTSSLKPQTNFGTVSSFTLGGPDDFTNTANGWMNSLSGDLDEFKIFSKELSSDEIRDLYTLQSHNL